MNGIFLLLGSNQGDRQESIRKAQSAIRTDIGKIEQTSAVYETAPWGNVNQPPFLNQVLKVTTRLAPEILLEKILRIENNLGRVRGAKWSERLIDIDILYYNNQIIHEAGLEIPHPGIPNRKFTLVPLCEIAPDQLHPVLKKRNIDLLNETTDNGEVIMLK